jgi:hypothetical protein
MSSAPLARPVDEKETNPAIKVWKDIKWKIQPEAYNVRKLMLKALEKAVDSSESLASMLSCESGSLNTYPHVTI